MLIHLSLTNNPTRPISKQKPKPLPDRKALDDIIFDILGLTEDERNEVYWSVCELVKNRLEKAKSVQMKPIRLSGHAKEQLIFRGTTEDEIIEAISTTPWQLAELGRFECKKDFIFEKEWNKRYYKIKQVRLIFTYVGAIHELPLLKKFHSQ